MEIKKIEPADNGKSTQITIEMTTHEARLFELALKEGKLAHLGITGASIAEIKETGSGTTPWTTAERDKRATPKNAPKPKRR